MSHIPTPSPSPSSGSTATPPLDAAALLAEVHRLGAEVSRLNAFANAQQQRPSSASSSSGASRNDLPKIASPSKFAGTMGNAVDDWIKEILQQFNYYGVAKFPDEATLIRFAVAHLTGAALMWWSTLADNANVITWKDFEARLHGRFRPVQAAMLARQKLGQLRMRPQHKVAAYVNVFLNVLNPIADMSDADQVHHFVNGLLPRIAEKVWPYHPKTLKEAIDQAVTQEAMLDFGRSAVGGAPAYMATGGHTSSAHSSTVPMDISNVSLGAEVDAFMSKDSYELNPNPTPVMSGLEVLAATLSTMNDRINALSEGSSSSSSRDSFRRAPRIPGLTAEKVKERRLKGECFKCGEKGHMKNECPKKN